MSGLAPLVYTSGFGFIGFWYLGKREREREREKESASQSSSKSANQLRNCPPPAQYYRVPPAHNNINVLCSLLINFLVTRSYFKIILIQFVLRVISQGNMFILCPRRLSLKEILVCSVLQCHFLRETLFPSRGHLSRASLIHVALHKENIPLYTHSRNRN